MMDRDELLKLIDAGDTYGLLKATVRAHANGHVPRWACSSVVIRSGEGANMLVEELLVLPTNPEPSSTSP